VPPMRLVPAFRSLVPHAVDTLPFAVQVSAWTSLVFALDAGDALEAHGVSAIVAPLRSGRRLWYRVYAGPAASRDAADSLLGAVRAAGLDRPQVGRATLVPLSLALRRVASAAAARVERQRLRAAGIPAFVLGQPDGSYRLFAGAYDAPEQAAYLDSLVTSTGSAGPLGPRVGFHP
jgi:cell division septation protein DedD